MQDLSSSWIIFGTLWRLAVTRAFVRNSYSPQNNTGWQKISCPRHLSIWAYLRLSRRKVTADTITLSLMISMKLQQKCLLTVVMLIGVYCIFFINAGQLTGVLAKHRTLAGTSQIIKFTHSITSIKAGPVVCPHYS